MYTCRECEREINQATEVCPYCGADLTAGVEEIAEKKPSTARIVTRWALLLGLLAAVLWGFLWYVLPERRGNPTLQAEMKAMDALVEVRGALSGYAEAQGGAFPGSLDTLLDRVRGAAQSAQSAGYQLLYTPGNPGGDGVVRTYALAARAGNFGYRSFYTDETGVLRATRENRAATAQDPPVANPARSR